MCSHSAECNNEAYYAECLGILSLTKKNSFIPLTSEVPTEACRRPLVRVRRGERVRQVEDGADVDVATKAGFDQNTGRRVLSDHVGNWS
jgi:hypothetical protein